MSHYILKRPTFYIELSNKEIRVATKIEVSVYPVWLGKNRAVMKNAIKKFLSEDPMTLYDTMDLVGKFGLDGVNLPEKPNKDNFGKPNKINKKNSIFY